jgi:hypothetical protein
VPSDGMRWRVSDRFDPAAVALADRHYSRQKPGTAQFVRSGSCVVLVAACGRAVWATWRGFARHAWAGAWENVTFRNEGAGLSSDLILEGVAATVALWGAPPDLGMVTMVDVAAVRPKRDPGYCYLRAGFVKVGYTSERKRLVLQLVPERFPAAREPLWTPQELVA